MQPKCRGRLGMTTPGVCGPVWASVIVKTSWYGGPEPVDPNPLRSLPLPDSPAVVIFQAGDYEVGGGVGLKVLNKGGGETTLPNVVKVL